MAQTTQCVICGKQVTNEKKFMKSDSLPIADNKRLCLECFNQLGGLKLKKKWGLSSNWTEDQLKSLLTEDQLEGLQEKQPEEIRKVCNVCGHTFCYTQADLERNRRKQLDSGLSSLVAATQMFGGLHTSGAVHSSIAKNTSEQIIDYTRCPKCGSKDLRTLTSEEWAEEQRKASSPTSAPVSAADELKKFKELLDMGVITQEEFDAKKKQLLGL